MRKKIIALLIVFAIVCALPGCAGVDAEVAGYHGPYGIGIFPEDIADRNFDEVEFVKYDLDNFISFAEETKSMIKHEEKPQEIADRIREALLLYTDLLDFYVFCQVHFSIDVTDKTWGNEVANVLDYSDIVSNQISEIFTLAAESKAAKKIAKALDIDNVERLLEIAEDYKIDNSTQGDEARLINEYYSLMNEFDNDPDEEQTKQIGEILIQLIELRNSRAKKLGYENYLEMAYDESPISFQEIERFEEMMAQISLENRDIVNFDYNVAAEDTDFEFFSKDEVIRIVEKYLPLVDEKMASGFKTMKDKGFFILSDDKKSQDTGYTQSFYFTDLPIVYNFSTRDFRGVTDSFHEFGHAYSNIRSIELDGNFDRSDVAFDEVQSSGLEAIMTSKYDEIYGDFSDEAKMYMAGFFLKCIIGSAADDRFERKLYTTPDLTPEIIAAIERENLKEFGMSVPDIPDYTAISHLFDNPLYQQNYMYAYFISSQLMQMAGNDFEKAKKAYLVAANCGAESFYSIKELPNKMKLVGFDDEAKARNAMLEFMNYYYERIEKVESLEKGAA